MNAFLKLFLSMSCSGALLILILLFEKRFLKDRISRQWQYYIWLFVIMRLLLPFGTEINLMGTAYEAIDQAITKETPSVQKQPATVSDTAPAAGLKQERGDRISSLANYICLVWLSAAVGMLIRKVTVYQSFVRYINAGLAPVSDMDILDRLSIAAGQMGIKKPVELCVNPQISSPLFMGFFHPCIVVPRVDISEKDFQYILMHELTHYKRKDMFYKWLVQATVCLHWFNPFVHLMSREIAIACEFSCDEAVLVKTGYQNAIDYGKTLLDAMAAVGKYKESPGAVKLSGNKKILKERLTAIMKCKKKSKATRMITAVLTLCIAFGSSFLGVYPVAAASGKMPEKQNANHQAEYNRFDITVKGSAYYYDGTRIRIFHDRKADCSFENSFVDLKGVVDVRLTRGKRGAIQKLEIIPKDEADEILEDLFGYVPNRKKEPTGKNQNPRQKQAGTKAKKKPKKTGEYTDIQRCESVDVPADVRAVIKKQCTGSSWYLIRMGNKKYVYYNNLPGDYAFNISGKVLNVYDMGRHTGIYVLLSVGSDFDFTLSYNGKPVVFTTID